MASVLLPVLCAVCSYLLGGLNTAILLSRALYHEDVRTKGSGNPGFTNFKRAYGMKYAWLVFVGDLLKTILPVLVFSLLFGHFLDQRQLGASMAGFCAMLGHSYPIWYRFKGGKSFTCMAAYIWFVDWRAALLFAALFLLLLFTVRIMSLSSMSASILFPIVLALLGVQNPLTLVFVTAGSLLLIWRHRQNLVRLRNGEEPKFSFFQKTA